MYEYITSSINLVFKTTIKKLDGPLETRLSRFLLQYRITPQSTTGLSPSELLMGRRLRTVLDLLHPDIPKKIEQKQEKIQQPRQKIRTFSVGDKLYAKNYSGSSAWIPVTVIKITGPVSYHVETKSGIVIRRHVDQLRSRCTDSKELQIENKNQDNFDDSPIVRHPQNFTPPTVTVSAPANIRTTPLLRRSNREKRQPERFGPYISS